MGSWRGRLFTVAALVGALTLVAAPAHADGERATSYVVDAALRADGTLTVSETISFDGAAPATLTQRLANFRDEANDVRYAYTIRDVKASAGSKDLGSTVTTEDGYTVISVPTASVSQLTISYAVTGATTRADDGLVDFSWRVLQGLSVPVVTVSGTVSSQTLARDYTLCVGSADGDRDVRDVLGRHARHQGAAVHRRPPRSG